MRVAIGSPEIADGRTRRRFAAMRAVQEAALDLFEARGFSAVTIEEIAEAAGVGPATVYRNFGTKERIVLWDEYDPQLFAQLATRLPAAAPAHAVLDSLIAALEPIYAADRKRILRRSRLAMATPELRAAMAADMQTLRRALAVAFVDHDAAHAGLEAEVLAAAIAGTLEAAIEAWVRDRGRTTLSTILRRAFRYLATSTKISDQRTRKRP
jgi:AcrR family transcriptional regulator